MTAPKAAQPPAPASIRVLPDGTVTLPSEVVRAAGIAEGETIAVSLEPGGLRLVPAEDVPNDLSPGLRGLYRYFAPVREEARESGISEEDLFALIDEAIAPSRRARPLPQE